LQKQKCVAEPAVTATPWACEPPSTATVVAAAIGSEIVGGCGPNWVPHPLFGLQGQISKCPYFKALSSFKGIIA